MSAYPENTQTMTDDPERAPAPQDAGTEPAEATAAENDRSECPYCGVTSHHQVRRYRFCGHAASGPSAR